MVAVLHIRRCRNLYENSRLFHVIKGLPERQAPEKIKEITWLSEHLFHSEIQSLI